MLDSAEISLVLTVVGVGQLVFLVSKLERNHEWSIEPPKQPPHLLGSRPLRDRTRGIRQLLWRLWI